ncbi:MAG: YceD family protein [Candidatus Gastranaerophilaceae bacterium]
MEKIILLEDLENAENKTLYMTFDEKIEGLDCVTPIKAELCAKSLGDFVQISGHVNGKILLECDLCLEKFEYELDFDIDEVYSKHSLLGDYEESGQEFELKDGQFVTDLNGENEIDIYDLLYQSVILDLPNKKVCGINCKGREFLSEEISADPRLEVFKNIQINPKK